MCQIFNESMENAAPFPQTQRQWNYRAHCYMTTYYWTDFMRTRCVGMMKIWPVNDMPEWVPNLRERWVIVNKAKKENDEEVEAFLKELEQKEDEESLQAASEMRQIFARRLSERPLWKQRRQDELVARKRAEKKEFANIHAAAAEHDQREKNFREKEDRERAWVAERMRLEEEKQRLEGERLQSSQETREESIQPTNNQEQRPPSIDTEQSLQVKKKVCWTREGTKQQTARMMSGGRRRLASLLRFGEKEDKKIDDQDLSHRLSVPKPGGWRQRV